MASQNSETVTSAAQAEASFRYLFVQNGSSAMFEVL